MNLEKAQRKRAKIKMGLQGPSGSGKTFSALLVAFGICGDWSKIAVIDSENHSAELYSHLGGYNVLPLSAPFTPEKYIEALSVCENAGMEVIIIDSMTHSWENLLAYHSSLQGNSFTNWAKVTPRQDEFVQHILQSPAHIIATIRTKQDYILSERNGKLVPEKVGLKAVQRDGLDYEFTLVFDLNIRNNAVASKDRTNLFSSSPEQRLSIETGKTINAWCNSGAEVSVTNISTRISECRSIQELLETYKQFPQFKDALQSDYENQKRLILLQTKPVNHIIHPQHSENGTH